jgi:TonB-dependent starch-binding outer membrane protein SusC
MVFKAHYAPPFLQRGLTKTLLVMQLTTILLTVAVFGAQAAGVAQTVSLTVKDAPLETVFKAIERQTNYVVFAHADVVEEGSKVTLDLKNVSLAEALEACFRNLPYTWSIEGRIIAVERRPVSAGSPMSPPPPLEIHGRVTDSSGVPLEGASIMIKGAKRAVQTDAKGNFDLPLADSNATLVVSYTGMTPRTVRVSASVRAGGALHITLVPSDNPLDQAQVIAYGTNTRRFSVGSVSKITSEDIAQEPISNPMMALEGRIAGLDISQTNGIPGSGQALTVRGLNSLNMTANNPLVLVDGVPFLSTPLGTTGSLSGTYNGANYSLSMNSGLTPFNLLNPADIESISVLKDADATAIYGSRGANGVVLITTKKGKLGNQTQLDVNVSGGFGKVGHFMDLLNTPQYLEMRHEAFNNDGETPTTANAPDLLVWDTTRYTNWQKVLMGGAASYNNDQVSLSGGNENTHFIVNASHIEQGNVFPGGFGDNKDAGRFGIDHTSLNKRFKANFSVSYLVDNNIFTDSYFVQDALTLAPDAPPIRLTDGQLNWAGSTWTNPYSALQVKFHSKTDNLTANGALSYDILKGLQLRATMGYNNVRLNSTDAFPESSYDPALYFNGQNQNTFTSASTETWNIEPQLEYRSPVGPGRLDVLAGTTFEQMVTQETSIAAYGFLNDALINDLASANSNYPTTTYSKYDYNAVFARIGYVLSDKYIVDLTGRRDGSSRFGPGRQFGNFGSVGAGWLFGNERLIKDGLPFLSYGKLRGSYGITGSDNIQDYGFISTYVPTSIQYGGNGGLVPNNLANPDYSWESNKKLDGGVELGFVKDRILLNVDYYRDRSSNQLVGYPLPSTTGFASIQYNLPATVQNTGVEVEVSTVNIRTSTFTWRTSLNFTVPRNKLLSYPNFANSTERYLYAIGEPLNIKKVVPFAGIDPATGIATYYGSKGLVTSVHDLTLPQDFSASVDVNRKYYGGIQNSLQYKGWQLDFLVQAVKQLGFKNMPNVAGSMYNQPTMVLGRWQKPGDITDIPRFAQDPSMASFQNWAYGNTTNGYTNASFVRLKNVALGYNMPAVWLRKVKVRTARLYFQGQNLFVITKYKYGPDPETESYLLPPLRQLVLGLQVTL